MHDLALALVTIGGAGLLDEGSAAARDHLSSLSSTASSAASAAVSPMRRAAAEPPAPRLPRTFDELFALHGRGLPVAYLRALGWYESRLQRDATTKQSSATGLLQIIDVVRTDHNRIYGTAYTREDLIDPVVNIAIGAAALRRIIGSYKRNHADCPNLVEDWNNHHFVALLTLGWNAGWSERAGVGRVVRYLKQQLGTTDITAELVHQHARAAGATKYLQRPDRLAWAEKVARQYAVERARDQRPMIAVTSSPSPLPLGPPASAVPIDPYAMTPQGPITSPSQLAATRAQSAALGAELASVLTSSEPSSSRRPVLPSPAALASLSAGGSGG